MVTHGYVKLITPTWCCASHIELLDIVDGAGRNTLDASGEGGHSVIKKMNDAFCERSETKMVFS